MSRPEATISIASISRSKTIADLDNFGNPLADLGEQFVQMQATEHPLQP